MDRHKESTIPQLQRWTYPYFKGYLRGLKHGEQVLHRMKEMPKSIELNEKWHTMLNNMRNITHQTMLEHHALVWLGKDNIAIQNEYSVGERHKVPGSVIANSKNKMREIGISTFIGDVHSHPRRLGNSWDNVTKKFYYYSNFSAADLYILVRPKPNLFMAVVEGDENTFAFRTSDSIFYNSLDYLEYEEGTNQEKFKKSWYRRRNIETSSDGRYARKIGGGYVSRDNFWEVNRDIARWHKLAIYRGKPNERLNRFFPPQFLYN